MTILDEMVQMLNRVERERCRVKCWKLDGHQAWELADAVASLTGESRLTLVNRMIGGTARFYSVPIKVTLENNTRTRWA